MAHYSQLKAKFYPMQKQMLPIPASVHEPEPEPEPIPAFKPAPVYTEVLLPNIPPKRMLLELCANLPEEPEAKILWLLESLSNIRPRVSVRYIQHVVAKAYNVDIEDLTGPHRCNKYVYPRHVGMFLSRAVAKQSYPKVGWHFGGRDHTTVFHAYRKFEHLLERTPWANAQTSSAENETPTTPLSPP